MCSLITMECAHDRGCSSASVQKNTFYSNKRTHSMGREHILNMHMTGAVDLLPFHPVGGASMEDAAQTSRTVAERVGRELGTTNLVNLYYIL